LKFYLKVLQLKLLL